MKSINFPTFVYDPQDQFYLREWIFCRETLLSHYRGRPNNNKYLFYYYNNNNVLSKIVNFLIDFQSVARIPVKLRCKIFVDHKRHMIAIRLNRFWRSLYRFSLLTALIRIGSHYKDKKLYTAIKLSQYNNSAIFRFMQGYFYIRHDNRVMDDYGEEFNGWCDYFSYNDCNKILYKKKRIKK